MSDCFAQAALTGPVTSLGSLDDATLLLRMRFGESPLGAAAVLASRGHAEAARVAAGGAVFLGHDALASLPAAGPMGAEGLLAVVTAPWLSPNARVAAAEALGLCEPTSAMVAALSQLSEGPKKPPYAQCLKALQGLAARVPDAQFQEAERLKSWARQVREGVKGLLRRQEVQRMVAAGELHPVVGLLVGDEGAFLAGLLPPVADGAREGLTPSLVAVLRSPAETERNRVLAMFQRRWRDPGARVFGALARTPHKGREAGLGQGLVKALGVMGAVDELAAVLGAMGGPLRAGALGELERLGARGLVEADPAVLGAALGRAQDDPDPGVAARARALSASALTMLEGA
ncbi:MAG: hypothetical protein JNK72_22740 [Myxococcales bacterium]|nr:hypothetical protein [Myxococcales bacterium]